MKNLLYIFLVFGILFSSCEEETDDPFNSTSSFSCMIDGVQLSDPEPIGRIITQGTYIGGLEISGTSNLPNARVMNTLYITVKDFSNVAENTNLTLGLPADGFAIINIGIDEYITDSPPYIGIINFSKITANKVSGTFSFDAHFGTAGVCPVTEGSFSDVNY
tara:strand:- start:58 stop:543 length:486 start_codon:yes stop_codon:yes gene_type:complete